MDYEQIQKAAQQIEPFVSIAANGVIVGGVIGAGFSRFLRGSKVFASAVIGIFAAGILLGAIYLIPNISPYELAPVAAVLAFICSVSVFVIVALNAPSKQKSN